MKINSCLPLAERRVARLGWLRLRSKKTGPRRHRNSRGSTVLIIIVLLACMAMILAVNSTALALLKQELKAMDRQQQQKYGQDPRH